MKILLVNKFYYQRGGAETYILEIEKKLLSLGHEVAIFSMHHPKNIETSWSKYFISRVSFNEGGMMQRLVGAARVLYSFEAKKKFQDILKDFKPDIIHLHNIYHQISPSILPVAKKLGIPVVMHLHDYKLICPNYQLFDGKRICYDCLAPHYWKCFFKKCFGNSYLKSFLVSLESFFHHSVLKIYEKNISLYIAPSKFMKELSIKAGVPTEKIITLYNFTLSQSLINSLPKNYLLYVGRLSSEKGLLTLLEAAKIDSDIHIKIVGSGTQANILQKMITENKLESQIELTGQKDKQEVMYLLKEARAVIIPSVWLENMPFALLEAMSAGKVVIAANIGGLPELITNGVNGFIFTSGDSNDLVKKIKLLKITDLTVMGQKAQAKVAPLNLDTHTQDLLNIYKRLLASK